jgi:hypothetical protein
MKKSLRLRPKMKVKITITDVAENNNSVRDAIEAVARESDIFDSGVVGPEFATSGPIGPGWTRQNGPEEFAAYSLREGMAYYVDSYDGRAAYIDEEDDEMYWTKKSVVHLKIPTLEEALEYPDAFYEMLRASREEHSVNVKHPEFWNRLERQVDAAITEESSEPSL